MSKVVLFEKQNNPLIQNNFLDSFAQSLPPDARVIIVKNAGFQNAWFHHITSLGWDFIGRIRNNVHFCLDKTREIGLKVSDCLECKTPEYMGQGKLVKETKKSI
ncbi:putative transposase of Tn10 [Candidatus Erwinia dacicola]|uniref:Transposase of Tn10 n=1 Tax=Candidatus Erwinia dacicola TaxID=252393 RepID=A0A328TTT5_9GAMM|nr:putative transposase of Tn10 [Candidatus Erwinia dacicola]